jgi:hypothetical protein
LEALLTARLPLVRLTQRAPERYRKSTYQKNEPTAAFVASVWKAVQWRTTTHLIHETFALVVLFNVDTSRFADWTEIDPGTAGSQKECDNCVQELMYLLSDISPCAIPPAMIFLPGPKLSEKGYRWASRTWLTEQQIDHPDPFSIAAPSSRLEREGLFVRYPGFLLH